jgi:hypothetical protein
MAATARARAAALTTLSRSLGGDELGLTSAATEHVSAAVGPAEDFATRLGDNERGLHMVMDLAEESMPRVDAEAQFYELRNRVSRLEQLDWRAPAASGTADKGVVSLERSVVQLEHQLRQQAAQLAELTARQALARPGGPSSSAGLTAAEVSAMIEQGVAAAMSQSASSAVASPPPPAERTAAAAAAAAVDTDVSHTTDGRLEELRLSAAAMHRRLLACEELAADAAARTECGLTEALPAMEQRLTETAVSESGRALREEIAGVRARCSSMEDQVEAGLRSSTAAIEHGLASLSDALRSEISSTNSGLCRAEDLRQAAAELRGSVTDAQNTAAKSYADLRQEVADQLMAAAAQTRTRFEESSASSDGRLQGMAERLDSMTGAIGAVEAGASARFEEIAVQMTQMAAAVDAQIEVASESMTMTVREGAEAAVNAVAQLEGEMRDAH